MKEWFSYDIPYYDIPRSFTAVAQWGACVVYLFILKNRYGRRKTFILSALFLPIQCILLKCTGNLDMIWWFPAMAASAFMMWLMLFTLCKEPLRDTVYFTSCSFLMAETAASVEWLIHYYVVYICGFRQRFIAVGMPVMIYTMLFFMIGIVEKRLVRRKNVFLCRSGIFLFCPERLFLFSC